MLGYVGANVLEGIINPLYSRDLHNFMDAGGTLLDVRTQGEFEEHHIADSTNIPLENLRESLGELALEKDYAIVCGVGQRAYYANQILRNNSFKNVSIVSGGISLHDALRDVLVEKSAMLEAASD
jgi:rhodanese-related sulfurtransferase